MKKIDKLVCAPHFYTMEGEGVGYRANAAMAVDCGKILEVGPRDDLFSRYLPEEVIELKHHMVLPGFIDGHMHTACNIMRGLAQDTNSWMMFGLQPFDNAVNDEERDAGSRVAIVGGLHVGGQQAAQVGQAADEPGCQTGGLFALVFGTAGAFVVASKTQAGQNLPGEQVEQTFYVDTDVVVDGAAVDG